MTNKEKELQGKLILCQIENANLLQQNISLDDKFGKMQDFILQLADKGGSIISSNDCSIVEISQATACGRMFLIDSLGFIYRTKPKEINAQTP